MSSSTLRTRSRWRRWARVTATWSRCRCSTSAAPAMRCSASTRGAPSTFTREPDPASLLAAFAAGATHAFLVPAVVSALLAAGETAITALSELKYLLYGAAPMPLAMLRQALVAWPGLNFVQVYGQTELAGVIS